MKAKYIQPAIVVTEAMPEQMMALSVVTGGQADPDADVLSREQHTEDDWSIWGD